MSETMRNSTNNNLEMKLEEIDEKLDGSVHVKTINYRDTEFSDQHTASLI